MYVDLSTSQYIPFGKMLCSLFYNNPKLLSLAPERSGYPHNGGEHTLSIKGDKGDIIAFLDLLLQAYPFVVKEIVLIKDAVHAWKLGDNGVYAKKLFSQHIYDYHTSYTYKEQDGVIHFYPSASYEHRTIALEAIHHLSLCRGHDDDAPALLGIVHYDAMMAVTVYSSDDTDTYMRRLRTVQKEIAEAYGDEV